MLPPAPGRLSTTACSFHASAIFCAAARARMSVVPPGGNGTTMRIGLVGNAVCASAAGGTATATTSEAARAAISVRRFI